MGETFVTICIVWFAIVMVLGLYRILYGIFRGEPGVALVITFVISMFILISYDRLSRENPQIVKEIFVLGSILIGCAIASVFLMAGFGIIYHGSVLGKITKSFLLFLPILAGGTLTFSPFTEFFKSYLRISVLLPHISIVWSILSTYFVIRRHAKPSNRFEEFLTAGLVLVTPLGLTFGAPIVVPMDFSIFTITQKILAILLLLGWGVGLIGLIFKSRNALGKKNLF